MPVHTRFFGRNTVLGKGARGHGDDRHICGIGTIQAPDPARGLVAVHVRHHDVHQDRIDRPGLALLKDLHGLAPVPGLGNARAPLLEQKMRDLHVEFVILGNEDVEPLDRRGLVTALLNGGLLIALVDRKRQQHVKGAAAPLLALHRDTAAHCVDQALCDRHAKTRPAVFGAHRFVLLRERLE